MFSTIPTIKKMKVLQKFRSVDGAGDVDVKIEGEVNIYLPSFAHGRGR